MNTIKITTLSMGASLIGSSLLIVLAKPDLLSLIILAMGFTFLLHGTGFLQEYVIEKFHRWYRIKKPVIGIIDDLPYSSYGHVSSKMEPKEWILRINNVINKSQFDAKTKLIKITRPWTRWFLDRYSIILNPYGPRYPETDIENLTVMKSILKYVRNGGVFVNVADIPFFFPYDKEKGILYCLTGKEIPHYYKMLLRKLQQMTSLIRPDEIAPGYDSPFSRQVMVDILDTTQLISKPISLKLKDGDLTLTNVIVDRSILCTEHVESVVEELGLEWMWKGERRVTQFTPFCYIHYGKGKILASLIWLDRQPEDIREKIINLICDLVIKEVRRN